LYPRSPLLDPTSMHSSPSSRPHLHGIVV
jgi:hypothetical protein